MLRGSRSEHLAQSLGLGCIAEGIETLEQLDYLERQHCEEIQGSLLGVLHRLSDLREMVPTTRITPIAER